MEAKGHFPSAGFRGYKGGIWDGGHRIPFIVRWPGHVKAGTESGRLVCLSDLIATCAGIVGETLPNSAGEDSISILPALSGTAQPPLRNTLIHHSAGGMFSMRRGKWKLILGSGSGDWSWKKGDQGMPPMQLYDMDADPGEKNNRYASEPQVVEALTQLLGKHVAEGRSTLGAPQRNDVAVDIYKRGV